MKTCRVCKKEKEETDFYKTGRKPDERHTECKECAKARIKANHDPERAKDNQLRRDYGITLSDFDRMVLEQGGRCACCGTDRAGGRYNVWNVDHCHETGKVRQLLCKDCNIVLGIIDDDPDHLVALIEYLHKHGINKTSDDIIA